MDFFIKPVFAQQPEAQIKNNFALAYWDLGAFVDRVVPIIFSIVGLLVFFYFIIGAFELITSQGDKAHIVSARSKIYHSVIGLILLIFLFVVMEYIIPAILGNNDGLIF